MLENAAPRLASLTTRRPRNTSSCRVASASLAARHVRANDRERIALATMGSSRRSSSIRTAVVGTICWVPGAM